MTNDFSALTVGDYAAQALTTDQRSDSGSPCCTDQLG